MSEMSERQHTKSPSHDPSPPTALRDVNRQIHHFQHLLIARRDAEGPPHGIDVALRHGDAAGQADALGAVARAAGVHGGGREEDGRMGVLG